MYWTVFHISYRACKRLLTFLKSRINRPRMITLVVCTRKNRVIASWFALLRQPYSPEAIKSESNPDTVSKPKNLMKLPTTVRTNELSTNYLQPLD